MLNYAEKSISTDIKKMIEQLLQKDNELNKYYEDLNQEKQFLKEQDLLVNNWKMKLNGKKGITKIFVKFLELILMKYDPEVVSL